MAVIPSQDFLQEADSSYLNGTGLADQTATTDFSSELPGKGFYDGGVNFLFPAH